MLVADFVSPLLNQMFLILIDAHSKWIEMHITVLTVTIEKMKPTFAIPEILMVPIAHALLLNLKS